MQLLTVSLQLFLARGNKGNNSSLMQN